MPLSANSDSSQLPHQVDDALTSIRAIKAQHRAEVIAKHLRLVDFNPDDQEKVSIIYNISDRIQVFVTLHPHPTDEDFLTFASELYTAIPAMMRGTR